jgi:photosynthetic reaction center H subunit
LKDAVGPAAYAERAPRPDRLIDGTPMIVPLRLAESFSVADEDLDPRGLPVIGADGVSGGMVSDLWIDRAEPQVRYLEVTGAGRSVLLPMTFAKLDSRRRRVVVSAINGSQFADVPGLLDANSVTRREEDRISAYYAGGTLYADPQRAEPFL